MIKRTTRPISFALASVMLLSSVPVMADYESRIKSVARLDTYSVNTPPEYTFQAEGNNKTFILLENKEGTNYILAKEHYKWTQYDPDETQKFDVEDPNNIAHWLNNAFLEPDSSDSNKLPEKMVNYIEEYTYKIEPGASNGNAPEPYEVSAKIALLSATEWKAYNSRFGIVDNIPIYGWWLRTGAGTNGRYMLWSSNDPGNDKYVGDIAKVTAITSGSYGGARPSFHLSDDFFKHNRVNLETVGDVVKDEVFAKMSYADFSVYTDDELRFLGVKDVPFRFRINAQSLSDGVYNMPEAMPAESVSITTDEPGVEIIVCTDKGEKISLKAETVNGEAVFPTDECGLIKSIETNGAAKELTILLPTQPTSFDIENGDVIYGAMEVKNTEAYDVLLDYSYSGVKERGAFTVDIMSITSEGEITSSWKPLCSDGGRDSLPKTSRRYALVDRTDDTDLILFRTRIKKGKVSVKNVCIDTVKENISFESDWDPYYLLESNGEQMNVKIKTDSDIPRKYAVKSKLTYRLDGEIIEPNTVFEDVKVNAESNIVLNFSKLRYGNAELEVTVYDGGRQAAQYKCEVCIYEPYEKKYFNKYTTGSINEMKSNRHPERPTAEIMEIANKLGFYATRMDPEWLGVEQIKGIYSFDGAKRSYAKHLYDKSDFLWSPITIAYNNPIYSDGDGKDNVDKPDEVQAYVDFAVNSALNYSDVQHFEFWNEPNFSTYWTGASPYEYVSAVKTASSFMRQVRSDLNLSAGSIDVSRNGIGYSKTLFDAGIYDYIDNFSTHPYYHPQRGDGVFESKTKSYMSIVEENGGWKDVDLTEIGWMGSDDNSLDLTQAEEIPKIIAVCDGLGVFYNIYCMYSKPAQRFNFLRLDYSARPSCASTSNFFNNFGGAEFLFRYQPNDTAYIYCYKRDGKYTLVAWDSQGDTTLNFDTSCKVDDIYGNFVGNKSEVKLTQAPQYIKNVSSSWVKEKFVSAVCDEISRFTEKNDAILTTEAKEQMKALADSITDGIDAKICELPYNIGLSMMENMGDSVFNAKNKQMLYELHCIGEMVIKLYGCGVKNSDTTAISEYNKLYKNYTSKLKYNTDRMSFTHDILRYAGREVEELEYLLAERGTTADTNMFKSNRNLLAKQLMRWAEYTMAKEDIVYLDTTFSMLPAQGSAIEGKDFKVDVSVFNSTFDEKLAGKLEVINTEGMVVATVDNVRIQARSHTTVNVGFSVTENKLNEQMFYTMRYTCGERSYESVYPITKIPQVEVKLMNSEVGADSMRDIKYELKNLMPEAFDMTLKVTAPDGWEVKEMLKLLFSLTRKR